MPVAARNRRLKERSAIPLSRIIAATGADSRKCSAIQPWHRAMTASSTWRVRASRAELFARTDADMVAAFTMNYPEEAIGIALAGKGSGYAGRHLDHHRDRRAAALGPAAGGRDHLYRR